jgi:cyclopropane fatty-acyl-phospholipid synthase-like methyltransferase
VTARAAILLALVACGTSSKPQPQPQPPSDGTYEGRRIAQTCSYLGADWLDRPDRAEREQPERVLDLLRVGPGMTVADVGAGTGYFTVRLARAVPQGKVIATDIEPDMVRYLRERAAREQLPNVTAVECGATDPKLPSGEVDRILVVDVWHHLPDRVAYAKGLAASLKPGGKLAIVDFTMAATHGPPKHHRLLPDAIEGDLRAAGLEASVSPTTLPDQYIVVGIKR